MVMAGDARLGHVSSSYARLGKFKPGYFRLG